MAKRTSTPDSKGTFAQLYDVHEELSRRNTKPLGRPPKKVRRKPTTVHLTPSESRNLTKLQLQASEQFTVNRSELTGIAIDLLALIMEKNSDEIFEDGSVTSLEAFKKAIYDFVKS